MNGLEITLFVLLAILLTGYLIFIILFFINYRLTKREYAIKNNFNDYNLNAVSKKFKYLESISKNNKELAQLMDGVNANKLTYDTQLAIVKDKIYKLTKINSQNAFNSSKKLTLEIENDFKRCQKMMEKLDGYSTDAVTYSKNISDILVQYRGLFKDIIDFYEVNLLVKYDHVVFKNMVTLIERCLIDASQYSIKINNEVLIKDLNELSEHLKKFYRLCLDIYVLDKIACYLQMQINNLRKNLKTKSMLISSNDFVTIQKLQSLGEKQTEDLLEALKNLDTKVSQYNAILAIKNIEEAAAKLEQTDKINVLIQKNMKIINHQIVSFVEIIKQITEAFQNLNKQFNNKDYEIRVKIDDLLFQLQVITLNYEKLQHDFKMYDSIDRKQFLLKTKDIALNISNYQFILNSLVIEVEKKFADFIKINNDLDDIKLTLYQLLAMANIQTVANSELQSAITNMIGKITEIAKKLDDNYELNYPWVLEQLELIKPQVTSYLEQITINQTFKEYAKRLIMYLNKYRSKDQMVANAVDLAQEHYLQNDFQLVLDMLIPTLEMIANSRSKLTNLN